MGYFARLYEDYVRLNELNIYSETRLKLPKPQYFVFYNGTKAEPDRQILKLSDSFPDDGIQPHLEVMVVALNINYGPEPDTVSYLLKQGAKIAEVPVHIAERAGGESYLKPMVAVRYMARMLLSILLIQNFRNASAMRRDRQK